MNVKMLLWYAVPVLYLMQTEMRLIQFVLDHFIIFFSVNRNGVTTTERQTAKRCPT